MKQHTKNLTRNPKLLLITPKPKYPSKYPIVNQVTLGAEGFSALGSGSEGAAPYGSVSAGNILAIGQSAWRCVWGVMWCGVVWWVCV